MQHVNGEINQNTLKSSPQSSWKEALAGTTVFTFVRKKMMLGQYTLWQIQNNYKPIKLEIHAHFSLFNIFQPSNVIIHYFCIWIKQQPTWNEKHDQKYYTHKIYIYIETTEAANIRNIEFSLTDPLMVKSLCRQFLQRI